MPNYTNHILANFAIVLILLFFYQKNPFLNDTQLILLIVGYFFGTVVLTPDLDLKKSEPSRRCGIACKPLTMVSRHRGLQHHWLYGIVIRILYVIMLISFLLAIVYGVPAVNDFLNILLKYKIELLSVSLGIFISNLLHIILDSIT